MCFFKLPVPKNEGITSGGLLNRACVTVPLYDGTTTHDLFVRA